MNIKTPKHPEPYSPSLKDFCRFLESYEQQAVNPKSIAELWEAQAEALRISREDASVETIDMLLDTMLTTLQRLAEAQEQQHWPNRIKAFFRSRKEVSLLLESSKINDKLLYNI